MPTLAIDPTRSTLSLQATSSLHPIDGEARDLRGQVEVDEEGRPTAMRLEVAVSGISSGNALYDRTLPRAVDARKFPTIRADSRDVAPRGDGTCEVAGEVSFHGQTVTARETVRVTAEGEGLRLRGSHTFDVRDFGVTPPKLLGLKVHPDVTVSVDIHATPNP